MRTKAQYGSNEGLYFYDGSYERTLAASPVQYYEDFIGTGWVIPAAGSAESGVPWVKAIVGAAPPQVVKIADQANGVIACVLTNANQAQTAVLYMENERNWSLEQGLIFEARIKLTILPTLVAEIVWGVVGNHNVFDTITYSAFFTADGSGAVVCETDDNVNDRSAASGVTLTTADWAICRLEAVANAGGTVDVLFFINGNQVATGTTFEYAGTGANAILQPYFGCYKASGTGVGTLYIDAIRMWQNRS